MRVHGATDREIERVALGKEVATANAGKIKETPCKGDVVWVGSGARR